MSARKLFALAGLLLAGVANACVVAPFNEVWANQGSATWAETVGDCRLDVSLATGSDGTAAATAHYVRRDPSQPFRASFRVGLPQGLTLSIIQSVQLLRGVARSAPSAGPPQARVFGVSLHGNLSSTQFIPTIWAACTSQPSGQCVASFAGVTAADFPLRITVEMAMGAGEAGTMKYWLGENTSGAPTGTLSNLDNAAWGGIERISLGLSESSPAFRQVLAGRILQLDQIVVGDPTEFWNGFDSSDVLDLVPNAAPIGNAGAPGSVINGSTCGGSLALPQVASGSSSLIGPVAIHPIPAGNVNVRQIRVSTSAAWEPAIFLCGAGLGPASPCISAAQASTGSSSLPVLAIPSLVERHLIVGRLAPGDTACYPYTLQVTGTLGSPAE